MLDCLMCSSTFCAFFLEACHGRGKVTRVPKTHTLCLPRTTYVKAKPVREETFKSKFAFLMVT